METPPNRAGEIQKHLFVIVIEPQGETKLTIIVPFATLRSKKHDRTTILEPGDYDDFIHKTSYVNYRRAEIKSFDELEAQLKKRETQKYPPLRKDIFEKVCAGILKSKFTPYGIKELYQGHLFHMM